MSIHEILEHHQKKILTERMRRMEGCGKGRTPFSEETTMNAAERYAWLGLQAYWYGRWRDAVQHFQTFLKIWPKSDYREDALYLYGDVLARHKKACRRVFEEALSRFPDSPYMPIARIELGEYFLNDRQYAEAEATFRKAREVIEEKSTLHDYATLRLAESLLGSGAGEEGIGLLEALVDATFQFDILREALLLLGRWYFMQGEDRKAFAAYAKVRRLWPEKLDQMPGQLFIYAQAALNIGALTQAREAFLKYTERAPEGTIRDIAQICCGDIARHIGKSGMAGRHYKRVNFNDGTTGLIARMRLADLIAETAPNGEKGSFLPQSIATLEDVVEECRHPRLRIFALWQLALRQVDAGMPHARDALSTLWRLIVSDPDGKFVGAAKEAYGKILLFVAASLLGSGKLVELCALDAEIEEEWLDRKTRSIYLQLLAEGYRRAGAYEEALTLYEALGSEGALADALRFRVGRLRLQSGDAGGAVAHFERYHAATEEPAERGRIAYWLARSLVAAGKGERAIPFFREAAASGLGKGYRLAAIHELARLFESLDSSPRAITAYHDYLDAAREAGIPWICHTQHHLGDLLYEAGHFEEAAERYHEAVVSAYVPGRGDWSLYRMAECYRHMHDERQAYQTFMKVAAESRDERLVTLANQTLAQLHLPQAEAREAGEGEG